MSPFALMVKDLRANAGHFVLASAATVFGIAAFIFFLGLGLGVRLAVFTDVYPSGMVEVAPHAVEVDVWALRFGLGSETFGEEDLQRLREIPGVVAASPRLRLAVPAVASGGHGLLGTGFTTEILADGIDPALVNDSAAKAFAVPVETSETPCASDLDCSDGSYCGVSASGWQRQCRQFIPVVISPRIVELYNGPFRSAYGLPKLNPEAALGLTCELAVGASTLGGAGRVGGVRERLRLVGISELAISAGVTMPLEHVRRLNELFEEGTLGPVFSSAILELESPEALADVTERAAALGFDIIDGKAEHAATVVAVLMAVFVLVTLAIVVVSAINIMHVFMMHVYGRRREIGVMRAVGARRSDIRSLILKEAAVVGLVAGCVGIMLGIGAGFVADHVALRLLPGFAAMPATFFAFDPWIILAALVLSVLSCLAGAIMPAQRAAGRDPAPSLGGR